MREKGAQGGRDDDKSCQTHERYSSWPLAKAPEAIRSYLYVRASSSRRELLFLCFSANDPRPVIFYFAENPTLSVSNLLPQLWLFSILCFNCTNYSVHFQVLFHWYDDTLLLEICEIRQKHVRILTYSPFYRVPSFENRRLTRRNRSWSTCYNDD